MFLTHTELLPEEETLEEHRIGKEAESRLVAADRAGRGLFKGLFHKNRFPLRGLGGALHAAAIVDAEDGVVRCPVCAWELEDGECGQCGWNEDEDDEDFNSDEDDRDISPVDDFGGPLDLGRPQNQHLVWGDALDAISEAYGEGPTSPAPYSIDDDDSEDDLEDEDDDDDMSSFISNDEGEDHPGEADGDDESVRTVQDYNEDSPARENRTHSGRRVQSPSQPLSPRYSIRRSPPRFHAIDVSDTSDDSGDLGDYDTTITTTTETSDDNSEAADDTTEQQTNYDSDSSSVREVPLPIVSQPLRSNGVKRRRIIEDDSDEEEESDDTAIRPTQANDARAQRLNGQRQGGASDHLILRMPQRRRISVSPDDEPPRQHTSTRRGGNSGGFAARRGRLMAQRVH